MDVTACNFDPSANCPQNQYCLYGTSGCTDITACNYDAAATCDDGSCILPDGCTDPAYCNYDPTALCDDGSCLNTYGCHDPAAHNYDPSKTCHDSALCIYPIAPIGSFYEGGIVFWLDETGQHGYVISISDIGTAQWGCSGTSISTSTSAHTGLQNTQNILAGCSDPGCAARLCDNITMFNYTDWYLPSKGDMRFIEPYGYTGSIKTLISNACVANGGQALPDSNAPIFGCWTSSQLSSTNAFPAFLLNGHYSSPKTEIKAVRPIRAF